MTDFGACTTFYEFVAGKRVLRGFHKMFHVEHTGERMSVSKMFHVEHFV